MDGWSVPAKQSERRRNMHTRRHFLNVVPAIAFLPISAHAQAPQKADAYVQRAIEQLEVPPFVRRQYAILGYYVELLQKKPAPGFDPSEANATYISLGRTINERGGKGDRAIAGGESSTQIIVEYDKNQPEIISRRLESIRSRLPRAQSNRRTSPCCYSLPRRTKAPSSICDGAFFRSVSGKRAASSTRRVTASPA